MVCVISNISLSDSVCLLHSKAPETAELVTLDRACLSIEAGM